MPGPMCRQIERQARHMSEIMMRLRVDGAAAVRHQRGVSFYEARTNCIRCREHVRCRRWLEGELGADHPAGFCPNMEYFGLFIRQ